MGKTKFLFWIEAYSETVDDADPFETVFRDIGYAAEEYSEYYHDNRDGWESKWPLVFSVANERGVLLGRVSVEREDRPHFSGRAIPAQSEEDSDAK